MGRNYTIDAVREAVTLSTSIAQVLERLRLVPAGGNYATLHSLFKKYDIDTSHFLGQSINKGKQFGPRRPIEDYLSNEHSIKSWNLKKRLIKEGFKQHQCECCKGEEWNGQPIPLELHHKDGDFRNNSEENLQLLCPGCHSLTKNFGARNKNCTRTHR